MTYPIITSRQVILRIALVISTVELFLVLALESPLYPYSEQSEIILNVIFLVLISSPIIFYWIINPFKNERDEAINELANMAFSDPLTGLPNRRVFLKCVEKTLAECARHHIHAALFLFDIDDFKQVNDTYGHDAGDVVLVEIGQRLLKYVRKEDVVSRVGGDEFIILIKQLNDDARKAGKEAMEFAEKIRLTIAEPIDYRDRKIVIDSSMGVNLLSSDVHEIEGEIRKADIAMYHAKRTGKGRVEMYDPSMESRESRQVVNDSGN